MRIADLSRATPAEAAALAALFQRAEAVAPVGIEQPAEDVQEPTRHCRAGQCRAHPRSAAMTPASSQASGEVADMGTADDVLRIRLTNVFHPDIAGDVRAELHHWLIDQAKQLRDNRGSARSRPRYPVCENDRAGPRAADPSAASRWSGTNATSSWRCPRSAGSRAAVRSGADSLSRSATTNWPGWPTMRPTPTARQRFDQTSSPGPSTRPGIRGSCPTSPAWCSPRPTERDNPVAGFLFALADGNTDTPTAILHCLGTRAAWRRSGVATAMISRALHRARSAGVGHLRLKVTDSNHHALALYRKLGFVESGQGFAVLMRQLTPEADERP